MWQNSGLFSKTLDGNITFAVGTFDVFWGTGLDKEATLSTKNNKLPGKDRLGLLYQKLDNKHTGMLRSSSLPSLILKSSREIFGSREKRQKSVTRATITSKWTISSLMNFKHVKKQTIHFDWLRGVNNDIIFSQETHFVEERKFVFYSRWFDDMINCYS